MDTNFFKNIYFLYVEDDELSRKVLGLILKIGMGVKDFEIFETSADFMARVRALPSLPDIILLDIHIHPHDGFEMLRMLRADPTYKKSKIIALTASVTSDEIKKMQSGGFNGAIGKPVNISEFPKQIQRILKNEMVWQV